MTSRPGIRTRPRSHRHWRILLAGAAPLALAACSGNLSQSVEDAIPKPEPAYKSSSSLPPLEVPPDLSKSTLNDSLAVPEGGAQEATTFSAYQDQSASAGPVGATQAGVLPRLSNARIERGGDERWLVVDAPASQVWPRVREFWLEQGFLLTMDDPSIGIMETDWAEKRTSFRSGPIEKLLGKLSSALYGTATRDKFRTRLERGAEPGTTEIFVSHRGAEEVRETLDARAGTEAKVWEPRSADPELEAEMLNRLMISFGIEQQRANRMLAETRTQRDRAKLVRENDGSPALALEDDFSRAWRRTGLALDRVGFTVEDRDRSRGLFYVRYVDPDRDLGNEKGFLSKLKFWGDEEGPQADAYLISLVGGGDTTQVVVLNEEGQREASDTADRILGLLHEQLR